MTTRPQIGLIVADACSTDERSHELNEATTVTFKATLRGHLIGPDDAVYDAAGKVYNGMIDRRPGLIAGCDVAVVKAPVNFGSNHGLPVVIRGGGHNAGGLGV